MSQAVISSNQSIKISSRIAVSGTSGGVNLIVYTVPANSYAVVNVDCGSFSSSGEQISFYIGGVNPGSGIVIFQSGGSSGTTSRVPNVYLGPGETVRFNSGNFGTKSYYVHGVEFTNSP